LSDRGNNVINLPLPPGTGDDEYIKALEEKVKPEIEKFKPDVVGVSVGFDAYYLDQGSVAGNELSLTKKTYEKVKELLKPYKTFFVLEGGYNPKSINEGAHALMDL
jgi:acetoin utilization deacetylase AcuC-like enzyme